MATNEITDTDVDQLYEVFRQLTASFTPHDAVKNLQLFRADEAIIQPGPRDESRSIEIDPVGPNDPRRDTRRVGPGRTQKRRNARRRQRHCVLRSPGHGAEPSLANHVNSPG